MGKKLRGGGHRDGSKPSKVVKIMRRLEVKAVFPEIERYLFSVRLAHPRGDQHTQYENNRKWRKAFTRFLVDVPTMQAINGGTNYCSLSCLNEESLDEGFKL